jgi:hypothetical protein
MSDAALRKAQQRSWKRYRQRLAGIVSQALGEYPATDDIDFTSSLPSEQAC